MIEPERIYDYIEPPKKKIKKNDDGFIWNHTMYHITMKGHIDPEEYLDWVKKRIGKRKLVHYSIVNEISDALNAYDHTHAAFKFDRAPGWADSKHLLHPKCMAEHYDIKPIVYKQHWDNTFMEYHRGMKQDKETGEYKMIPPIQLLQSDYDPNEKPFSEQVRERIRLFNTWKEVLDLDDNISKYISIRMHWAKDIFLHKDLDIQCRIETLFDWQNHLTNELKAIPDPRKIIWFVDQKGGKGKSELTKYLVKHHGAFLAQGKSTDIKYAYNGERIVIFDIPRSADHISWDAIESIKNGLFFNTKYYSRMKGFPTPHVVCFSNNPPPYDKLSEDRWDVRYIDEEEDPKWIQKEMKRRREQYLESQFED